MSAEQKRDEALARVEAGVSVVWMEDARAAVLAVASRDDVFTTDDVWEELDMPREPRAMGAVMMTLSREGHIRKTGQYVKSHRPECHARPVAVWEAA